MCRSGPDSNRYLISEPHCRQLNLMRDHTVQSANQVFSRYLAQLRREGKDVTKSKETILPGDVQKMYENVFFDTPQGLQ